jgi:FkbM family methyltransferase
MYAARMTKHGTAARRAFLEAKRREIHARGLMSYPASSDDEAREVLAFERLFDALDGAIPITHPFFDLKLELSPLLGPRIAYLITIGDYELGDLELLDRHVAIGDRVIELGGGAGLTAAFNAKRTARPVVVAEPDERLFPIIRRQVELNGGTVSFEHGVVLGGAPRSASGSTADFFLDEEIWFSSTREEVVAHGLERQRRKVTVPVLDVNALFAKHTPTIAMIDIEGAERDLFATTLVHAPKKILIEIHSPHYGERAAVETIQAIADQGYRLIDQGGWTFVLERR